MHTSVSSPSSSLNLWSASFKAGCWDWRRSRVLGNFSWGLGVDAMGEGSVEGVEGGEVVCSFRGKGEEWKGERGQEWGGEH